MKSPFRNFAKLTDAERLARLVEHVPEVPKDARVTVGIGGDNGELLERALCGHLEVAVMVLPTYVYDRWQRGNRRLSRCQQRFDCTEVTAHGHSVLIIDTRIVEPADE
jgi:hypothetical protein